MYCMHWTNVILTAVYHQSTLNGTPTCSSLSGTVSCEVKWVFEKFDNIFLLWLGGRGKLHVDNAMLCGTLDT